MALLASLSVFIAVITYYKISANTVYSFRNNIANISLTFDDGPHGTLTPKLLDILKAHHAKATFFVMGIKAKMHPDLLRRMVSEGHEVGNHAWDHPVLSKLPLEDVHTQINRTATLIESIIGFPPKVMRPPYGNTNRRLNNFIWKKEGNSVIMWSLDTRDWTRPGVDAIIKKVSNSVKAGEVILCHDIHPGTIEAMPALIKGIQEKGYNLLTVSEMVSIGQGIQQQQQRTRKKQQKQP